MRSFLCGTVVLLVCVVAFGKDYDATITKIDGDKVTAKVGDAEKVFLLVESTKYEGGKKDSTQTKETLTKRLEKAKDAGVKATISTEEKDGKEVLKDNTPVVGKVALKKKGA